uniref:hypothetical protein n=1 Tax=Porodaedalea mongolica TaxID=2651638 RepID=UPI0021AD0AAF|nr:hypothetical protein NYK79_mgp55 [Porodaedalea mongolica]UUA03935.1 hypothetical protein [Porodaedalea mongolica]WCF76695.1 hypothetical protein [Porodaedalea mongolica]
MLIKQTKQMIIKTVNLKTNLTNKSLRQNLYTFFRKYSGKSHYISIITKLSTKGDTVYTLNTKVTLNVNNKEEKLTFVNLITDKFIEYKEGKHGLAKKILICYYECDKEEYISYKKTTSVQWAS